MLTNKALEDFEQWMFNYFIENRPDYPSSWIISKFERKTQLEKLAFYVEWFDSIGVYILTTDYDGDFWCSFNGLEYSIIKPTRQEATKAAIEKANELNMNFSSSIILTLR